MAALVQVLRALWSGALPLAAIAACGAWYGWAVTKVRRTHPWPRRRVVSFSCGLALLAAALVGPVADLDQTLFSVHMVQHLVLMMIVAPLLLMGAPVLLTLQVSSRETRRRWLVPFLRSRFLRRLTHPVVSWLIFAGVVVGTHFTPFFNASLTHPALHEFVEHPLYLTAALVYFYPLVPGNPLPHPPAPMTKVLSLVLMMAPESMTGFFIYSAGRVLYPAYVDGELPIGRDPLGQQQLGGGLMWTSGMILGAVWISVAVLEWLRADARSTARLDQQLRREQARAAQA